MEFVYFSRTKNIEKFVKKSKVEAIKGNENLKIEDKYILITYTDKFGEVPLEVQNFLLFKENKEKLNGVIGSGNRNWGANYCKAATIISEEYRIPILQTFELSGTSHDLDRFTKIVAMYK